VLHGVYEAQSMPRTGLGNAAFAHPFWIARINPLGSAGIKNAVTTAHAKIYGDVVVVDQREQGWAPIDAYSMNEREPNLLEWYFVTGPERVRTLSTEPDPFLTWEWRTTFGQPADAPTAEPKTLNEMRIAHNVAVEAGDTSRAEALREKIEAQIDRRTTVPFNDGTWLIGVRIAQGVEPRLEQWFLAGGPTPGDTQFSIHSLVEAPEPWSLVPQDSVERDMGFPPPISTHLWKKGWIYFVETPMFHRIGTERYWGFFASKDGQPAPRRVDGLPFTNLAIIR
jgi:hypothetical protein